MTTDITTVSTRYSYTVRRAQYDRLSQQQLSFLFVFFHFRFSHVYRKKLNSSAFVQFMQSTVSKNLSFENAPVYSKFSGLCVVGINAVTGVYLAEPETVPRDLASPWMWWLSPDVLLADEDVTKVTGLVLWR